MKYPFPSALSTRDDTLDGEFRLDPERMRAFDEAESTFTPLEGEEAERANHAQRRALECAFEDAGFSDEPPEEAPLPARASWLDRIIRAFRAPGFVAGFAAVAIAVFVTSRLSRGTSQEELLAFSGTELDKRTVLRCAGQSIARTQTTPRTTIRWCEANGKKHGWSFALTLCGESPTPGCGVVQVECWNEGKLVDSATCLF